MADTYFVGLRGTGDLASNERPESWREGLLRLFPNGDMPLTALTSLMRSEAVTDPHYHWWTKTLTTQRAAITCFDDPVLSTDYTEAGGTAGQVLYCKMTAAAASMFREGHQVMLRDASDYAADCVGKVTDVVENGASSYAAVKLLEADDNSSSHVFDVLLIIGNINPQGGNRPEAITQSPTEHENYTQIFRNSLDLSRTLLETKLRTPQAYVEAKRDALEQHGIEMEKAFLWGVQSTGNGANGKPEYSTRGMLSWIKEFGVVENFALDDATAYTGKQWLQAGDQWIDEHLEEMFRYGSDERLAFCGSGALLGIQRLVKSTAAYQLTVRDAAYGIRVVEWVTPFGSIMLKKHPLFSYEATDRNSIVIFEPRDLVYRYITDTKFMPDAAYGKGGGTGKDGKEEEYLTECGLEFHFGQGAGYLTGIGEDNAVS